MGAAVQNRGVMRLIKVECEILQPLEALFCNFMTPQVQKVALQSQHQHHYDPQADNARWNWRKTEQPFLDRP